MSSVVTIVNTDISLDWGITSGNYSGTKLEQIVRAFLTKTGREYYINKSFSFMLRTASGNRWVIGKAMYVDATGSTVTFILPQVTMLFVLFCNYGGWNFTYNLRRINLS